MNSLLKSFRSINLSRIRQFHSSTTLKSTQFYPINDDVFGLNDEQKQLRQIVFNFVQKELAPKAKQIDQENDFKDMAIL
ncbi:unnamed protein product [Brachionus calyciflorus]|uniref:Acyl-CoA dehydrogenase/oxidase N-terminal domain-containing protein n=1 Tax=Brachionus calyciflorus TaxID=104777 RepID=A0A814B030_9BILA|nr:unnamed protein product [Brachionus calyciflorus]